MGNILAFIKRNRKYVLMLIDMITVCISYIISLSLYYPFEKIVLYFEIIKKQLIICGIIYFIIFYIFRLYESIWRYADVEDFFMCLIASLISGVTYTVVSIYTSNIHSLNFYITNTVLTSFAIISFRMVYRLYRTAVIYQNASKAEKKEAEKSSDKHTVKRKNLLIIGAGNAGILIKREIEQQKNSIYVLKCMLDDDKEKIGRKLYGTKVEGPIENLDEIIEQNQIQTIIVAIPSATEQRRQSILKKCAKTGCELKILPSIYAVVNEKNIENIMDKIKPVEIEDLLGRKPITLDHQDIKQYIKGKKVLVTGGGGSIGSELCRQIAKYDVKSLTIVDIYENNAYDIQMELKRTHKENLDLDVIIASVRDIEKLREIFNEKKPDIVFHAAAHKHVPLMERVPAEAIKNNIFGTYNAAKVSDETGVKKFVLISTDKAVNPTNIMGATKRMAEMIIQSMDTHSKTDYVAVRFGNVLGSNGSVIPLFKKQIADGGPVTVTDERIIRYFMTIPEAVQLVLKAGSIAKGGEIFILDMGEPVKIKELAENLIRLSGFVPYKDIDIVFTGLRPGEKLYEELLVAEEGLKETIYPKIFIGKPMDIKEREIKQKLEKLSQTIHIQDNDKVVEIMKEVVDTYKPNR